MALARPARSSLLVADPGAAGSQETAPGDGQVLAVPELAQAGGDEVLDPGQVVLGTGLRAQRERVPAGAQDALAPVQDQQPVAARAFGVPDLGGPVPPGVAAGTVVQAAAHLGHALAQPDQD